MGPINTDPENHGCCPNCGHCPTCGKSNFGPLPRFPYTHPWTGQPLGPYRSPNITWTTRATQSSAPFQQTYNI